jgi:hypothetical protein
MSIPEADNINKPARSGLKTPPAAIDPCDERCCKCGSADVHRRFFEKGKDTNGVAPNRDGRSTEWVDRREAYVQRALKDCIVHRCRCCGFTWDADPLSAQASGSKSGT